MFHKVIVFACKTVKDQNKILESDFCIVGDKLVQRYRTEQKLWITDLDVDELYQIQEDSADTEIQKKV